MSTDKSHAEQALEYAEAGEPFDALAVTHACLHVAEMLASLTAAVQALKPQESPRLAATLAAESPFADEAPATDRVVMPNGRPYRPAHDPYAWKIDEKTGKWISPAGRMFDPRSSVVLGVIRRRNSLEARKARQEGRS